MFLPITVSAEDRVAMSDIGNFQRYLKNCLAAIMVLGQNRQVIRKADLNKQIYGGERACYFKTTKLILNQACHDLYKYMGMRLFDLGDNKGYLLVNAHTELGQYRAESTDEECDELAVIFVTLMEIFSQSDEASTEEQIHEVLRHVITKESDRKKHFEFLVKKLYIVPAKEGANAQEERLYKWGLRAVAEIDPDKFMESFLDLAEDSEAKDWPDQQRRVELLKSMRNV